MLVNDDVRAPSSLRSLVLLGVLGSGLSLGGRHARNACLDLMEVGGLRERELPVRSLFRRLPPVRVPKALVARWTHVQRSRQEERVGGPSDAAL
jgi:hypothetical protein